MPPDYIWPFSDELDEWFTEIDFKRDNPDSNDSSSMGDLDENQFEFDQVKCNIVDTDNINREGF